MTQPDRAVARIAGVLGLMALLAFAASIMTTESLADTQRWKREGWTTDFDKTAVDLARIKSGGPARDGIPSIENPVFEFVPDHVDLADNEPIVGLTIDGDARAYPLRILTWHEIVNDVVGGVPVAVTYCPLCNSAPVFERTVDGRVLEFGVSGKLKDSNLIMYDRQTETWWQQFTGDAIVGEMVGERLAFVPARLQSYGEFAAENPNGRVLVPQNRGMRAYGINPYVSYDTSRPFLYDGQLPEHIDPMERVVIVPRGDDDPVLVRMAHISDSDMEGIETHGLVFTWNAGQASALDTRRIDQGRDVGTVLVQRDGADVAYDITFAFVAHAFHPGVEIVGNDRATP